MAVQRLMSLKDTKAGLMVKIRWLGLPSSGDTLEPTAQVYKNVPNLLQRLIVRQNTPRSLVKKA